MKRALLLLVLAAACSGEATTPGRTETAAALPADNVMYGVEHAMTAGGVRKAVLFGDSAYVRQSESEIDVMGVRLTFYDENGAKSGDLTSRTGDYNMDSESMVARGNVVLNLVSRNGEPARRIESEELNFDLKGDQIWSDQPTVMRQGASVTRGTSFKSDTRFQNLSIANARTEGGVPPVRRGNGGFSF